MGNVSFTFIGGAPAVPTVPDNIQLIVSTPPTSGRWQFKSAARWTFKVECNGGCTALALLPATGKPKAGKGSLGC